MGETEIVWDNLNPDFTKSFVIDFVFETVQLLKVQVVDCDDDKAVKNRVVGTAEFEVGTLVGSSNNTLILKLEEENKQFGSIIVRSEKVARENDILTMNFSVSGAAGGFLCFKTSHIVQ